MPKTNARKRPVTEADLTRDQREYYEALPEEFREGYLRTLPPVAVSGLAARKKAQVLRQRIAILDSIVEGAHAQKERLDKLAKNLEQGGNPDVVDLRQEMKPPVIKGVAVRFVRGK
jgi:hypothetical protein